MSVYYTKPTKRFTTTEPFTGAVGTYDLQALSSSRLVISSDASGQLATFTCQPGDQYQTSSGERTEIILGGGSNSAAFKVTGLENDVEYWTFSVKLSSPWSQPGLYNGVSRWLVPIQFHGPDSYIAPPSLALQTETGVYVMSMCVGNMSSKNTVMYPLTDNNLLLDNWVDFCFEIRWSTGTDGYVKLYRRNPGSVYTRVCKVASTPTMQYATAGAAQMHYAKAGIYRSPSSTTHVASHRQITRTTARPAGLPVA